MLKSFLVHNFDQPTAAWFLANRSDWGVTVFMTVSFLGSWQFMAGALAALVIILLIKDQLIFIAPLVLTVVGSEAVTFLGKLYFHRARPLVPAAIENTFSFPSGHATAAVAFYVFLAYLILKFNNYKKIRLISALTVLIILLIGLSRLYLGVHYLSDVLAGYLIGLAGSLLGIILTERLISRRQNYSV
jgi:undecaprenyl-diphosphatase